MNTLRAHLQTITHAVAERILAALPKSLIANRGGLTLSAHTGADIDIDGYTASDLPVNGYVMLTLHTEGRATMSADILVTDASGRKVRECILLEQDAAIDAFVARVAGAITG